MKKSYHKQKPFKNLFFLYRDQGFKIQQALHGFKSFSVPGQGIDTSFINQDACQAFMIDGRLQWLRPGDMARMQLKFYYPNGYRSPSQTWARVEAPRYYEHSYYVEPMIYIDIVSAYAQIYAKLNLDTLYPNIHAPCKMPLLPIAKNLQNLITGESKNFDTWAKESRNAIPGMLYSNKLLIHKKINRSGFKRQIIHTKSKFFNPGLWCSINTILHEIANFAVSCGAVYVATDGYIFLDNYRSKADHFAEYLNDLGLKFRMIIGTGSITSFGTYRVAGQNLLGERTVKTTKTFETMFNPNPLERGQPRMRAFPHKPQNNLLKNQYNMADQWSELNGDLF